MHLPNRVVNSTSSVLVEIETPTIALSGAASIDEGGLYTLTLGTIGDPGADTLAEWRVTWGDGSLEETYFAGGPVWGDVFGPYRYADYLLLPAGPMARKLAEHGLGTIVVRTALGPYVDGKPDFERYFQLVAEQDGVKAYRVLSDRP